MTDKVYTDDLASMYAEDGLRNMDGRLVLIGCVAPYAGRRCPPGRREHRMYVQTTNGYGDLVRPIREHNGARYATVRTSSGAWVSGRVLRIWSDADAATRDYYNAEQRKRAREHRERAR